MTEREILQAIETSARDVDIPKQLAPEIVQKRLAPKKAAVSYHIKQLTVAAAALVLVVGTAFIAGIQQKEKNVQNQSDDQTGHLARLDEAAEPETTEEDLEDAVLSKKQNAGDMFVTAQNYDQVYAKLEESRNNYKDAVISDGSIYMLPEEPAGELENDTNYAAEDMSNESLQPDFSGHSTTNLQTAGVDESDIIKTDGSFLYTVRQNSVVIADISGETPKQLTKITLEEASAQVMEMYVLGDVLNLIVQQEDAVLSSQEQSADSEIKSAFHMNSTITTHLMTYDIKDRENPHRTGDISQDGVYYTSRKIGNIVYLFTSEYAMEEIPLVNGQKINYDCIYLPDHGESGLVVSSVNVRQPGEVLDNVVILNDYVDIYVSAGAMYLYQSSWEGQMPTTRIAKFTLKQGNIQAVDAASVKGEILDTFAIQEGSGQLRVLTTDRSGSQDANHLFILDENLRLTGSLQGLAPGEQIYAARFFKDMAYFVTYRNTDPLFAVDLSDPANPRVLSELKITGFSEYLHFWGEDLLLGIGYETDPDTGQSLGIKLTMFDISDPTTLTVLDSMVLEDLKDSPALYAYKTVLADSSANLFGFAGRNYGDSGAQNTYSLYQWEEDGFRRLMKETLDPSMNPAIYRGLYSGSRFYLASPDGVTSYDRARAYEKIATLTYE